MHTEGFWDVVKVDRGFIITAKDGVYDVAIVRNIGDEDNQANAKLIASAPDLLEALQKLESAFMAHTQWDGEPPSEIKAARDAIKKATQ